MDRQQRNLDAAASSCNGALAFAADVAHNAGTTQPTPVEDPVMSARLTKVLLMLPLCAVLASVQTSSVRAQRPDDPQCFDKCMRNYGCGPNNGRAANDISCREFSRECRQGCTRR
jgi:hypothetical protein